MSSVVWWLVLLSSQKLAVLFGPFVLYKGCCLTAPPGAKILRPDLRELDSTSRGKSLARGRAEQSGWTPTTCTSTSEAPDREEHKCSADRQICIYIYIYTTHTSIYQNIHAFTYNIHMHAMHVHILCTGTSCLLLHYFHVVHILTHTARLVLLLYLAADAWPLDPDGYQMLFHCMGMRRNRDHTPQRKRLVVILLVRLKPARKGYPEKDKPRCWALRASSCLPICLLERCTRSGRFDTIWHVPLLALAAGLANAFSSSTQTVATWCV